MIRRDSGVEQTLRAFFENHREESVVAALLFGSRAEGREHRESDLDVAVLFDRQRLPSRAGRFEARLRLAGELIAATHENDVDLVVLNDAPPLFARSILWDGRRVWVSDADALRDFECDTQLRAADLEPWLRRYEPILLAAIQR